MAQHYLLANLAKLPEISHERETYLRRRKIKPAMGENGANATSQGKYAYNACLKSEEVSRVPKKESEESGCPDAKPV